MFGVRSMLSESNKQSLGFRFARGAELSLARYRSVASKRPDHYSSQFNLPPESREEAGWRFCIPAVTQSVVVVVVGESFSWAGNKLWLTCNIVNLRRTCEDVI